MPFFRSKTSEIIENYILTDCLRKANSGHRLQSNFVDRHTIEPVEPALQEKTFPRNVSSNLYFQDLEMTLVENITLVGAFCSTPRWI